MMRGSYRSAVLVAAGLGLWGASCLCGGVVTGLRWGDRALGLGHRSTVPDGPEWVGLPELSDRVVGGAGYDLLDGALHAAYRTELGRVFDAPERHRWRYDGSDPSAGPAVALEAELLSDGWSAFARILPFAVVPPAEQGWSVVRDSERQTVCARGPLGLTFRQAYHLGLSDVRPDALVDEGADPRAIAAALEATARKAGLDGPVETRPLGRAEVGDGRTCVFVVGPDPRDALEPIVGAASVLRSSKRMPFDQGAYAVPAQLLKWFASDVDREALGRLDLSSVHRLSDALVRAGLDPAEQAFVIGRTAEVMARAAAIPCIARLEERSFPERTWFWRHPPELERCRALRAAVTSDGAP